MPPVRRLLVLCGVAVLALASLANPAGAHTGFDSSSPRDGDALDSPVEEMTLTFTGPAEPAGDGFEVLDASGELRRPTRQSSPDGTTWVLEFDPPLGPGEVGVRWMVRAPDAHPIDGSFSFEVAAPPPSSSDDPPGEPLVRQSASPVAEAAPAQSGTDLDEFLTATQGVTLAAERLGEAGRLLGLGGTAIGVGALVFAATVLRGTRSDIWSVLIWARRGGAALLVGTTLELIGQLGIQASGDWSQAMSPSTLADVLWSSFGVAIGLRLLGARALVRHADISVTRAMDAPDFVVSIREFATVAGRELVGATPGSDPTAVDRGGQAPAHSQAHAWRGNEPYVHRDDQAWVLTADSIAAAVGAAAVVISYVFDGHTVTKGDRGLTGLLNIAHVGGAAVWVGGVAMVAVVLWRRHRDGRELRALQLALRFSVVASIALVVVGAAGLALTVTILDAPSELWSTPWGRLLIAKTSLVGVAAAMGGYNHAVLIPLMSDQPENELLARRFRRAVTIEAAVLGAVVGVTALLVAAAS